MSQENQNRPNDGYHTLRLSKLENLTMSEALCSAQRFGAVVTWGNGAIIVSFDEVMGFQQATLGQGIESRTLFRPDLHAMVSKDWRAMIPTLQLNIDWSSNL